MSTEAIIPFDTYVVDDDEHAILVLTGQLQEGCAAALRTALLESEKHDHGHVIVDVRQTQGVDRDAVKVLLWELGRAFDDGRTLRLVVRDEHQEHFLDGNGLAGLIPVHTSLADAMVAAVAAQVAAGDR